MIRPFAEDEGGSDFVKALCEQLTNGCAVLLGPTDTLRLLVLSWRILQMCAEIASELKCMASEHGRLMKRLSKSCGHELRRSSSARKDGTTWDFSSQRG